MATLQIRNRSEEVKLMRKGNLLGEGSYAKIYTATSPGKTKYAFKRFLVEKENSGLSGIKEIDMLNKLSKYPNFVKIKEIVYENPFKENLSPIRRRKDETRDRQDSLNNIMMELSDLGDLERYHTLPFKDLYQIMVDCITGLLVMKRNKILHRDIKPQNILLFENPGSEKAYTAKISDFGLAKYYTLMEISTPETSSIQYRAPELFLNLDYDYASDLWSMGLVFFYLLRGRNWIGGDLSDAGVINTILRLHPDHILEDFYTMNSLSQLENPDRKKIEITRNTMIAKKVSWRRQLNLTRDEIKEFERETGHTIEEFEEVLSSMIRFNPADRLTVEEVIKLPFFASEDIKVEKLIDYETPYVCCYDFPEMRANALEIILNIYNENHEIDKLRERKGEKKNEEDVSDDESDIAERRNIWLSDRVLFHTVRIFDLYTDYFELKTQQEFDLSLYYCLYFCSKFFNSIYIPPTVEEIIPKNYRCKNKESLERFEKRIFEKVLNRDVYRETIFEVFEGKGKMKMTNKVIEELLTIMCKCVWVEGKKPSEIIEIYNRIGYEGCLKYKEGNESKA